MPVDAGSQSGRSQASPRRTFRDSMRVNRPLPHRVQASSVVQIERRLLRVMPLILLQ